MLGLEAFQDLDSSYDWQQHVKHHVRNSEKACGSRSAKIVLARWDRRGLLIQQSECRNFLSYRIRAVKPTLPVLFGEVWLRLPVKVQRIFVTLRS